MTAQPVEEDGNLPAALRELQHAIDVLTQPQTAIVNDTIVNGPSLYLQLWDAVAGESNNGGGAGSGSKSRPPFWCDAFDLCHEIDQSVECWQPAYTGTPPTIGRLKWIKDRAWRPQDVHSIEQIITALSAWSTSIAELMNPTPKWTLPYPCPNCQAKTVYRRDSSGEMVRSNALQLSPDGCVCAQCRATWQPGQFLFLGRLLGSVPANVGE